MCTNPRRIDLFSDEPLTSVRPLVHAAHNAPRPRGATGPRGCKEYGGATGPADVTGTVQGAKIPPPPANSCRRRPGRGPLVFVDLAALQIYRRNPATPLTQKGKNLAEH